MRRAATFRPLAVAILLALGSQAHAVQPDEVLPDGRLEGRARAISGTLRCLVCQNQSIDDSDAPLARDLRLLVRERLKAGDTDSQVSTFLVARYGEFVLLRPVLGWHTALLWGGPLLVLLGGIAGLVAARRQTAPAPEPALTPGEQADVERLLAADPKG